MPILKAIGPLPKLSSTSIYIVRSLHHTTLLSTNAQERVCDSERDLESERMATMGSNALRTPVAGLGTSSLSPARPPSRLSLQSSFLRSPVIDGNPLKIAASNSNGRFTCFKGDWLRTDLNVIGFGLIGWIAPSSVPAIDGRSLTSLFFDSIGTELAHWPTGPALGSQFWLWMITWHLGLFLCLTFGQIGFKGRNDGYF